MFQKMSAATEAVAVSEIPLAIMAAGPAPRRTYVQNPGRKVAMTRSAIRTLSSMISVVGLLGLTACSGTDDDTVSSHTIELASAGGPSVSGVRDENGEIAAIGIGDTEVLMTQRLYGVSGSGDGSRKDVGSVLRNGELLVRHIDSHWNLQTDVVTNFEHIAYGAWATVEGPEGSDFTYRSLGDAYLIALDDARTPITDMPAIGTATWLGQGTGFIRGHGGSVFERTMSDVTMTADFANAEMTVDMLFTTGNSIALSGAIQGNRFSGTAFDVARVNQTGAGLIQAEGATARFSGGFYGAGAVEAGGVYEIVGGREQNPGRMVGTFGGRRTE